MKLPNAKNAVVEIAKVRDYCLNMGHPEGRYKARVFQAVLGMGRTDADTLQAALLAAARDHDAVAAEADEFGDRYVVDFPLRQSGTRGSGAFSLDRP